MSFLSSLTSPRPFHILAYGTLLGTEVFQSFIAGTTAFRVLPRASFSTLQSALFPIYFSMQTALPVVLALTFPSAQLSLTTATGGLFDSANRLPALVPLATIFITSLLNLAVVGPATSKTMRERKHQETRDGKRSYDPPPHSDEMRALNKRFGMLHGISSLLNMTGCVATVFYGFYLADRLV